MGGIGFMGGNLRFNKKTIEITLLIFFLVAGFLVRVWPFIQDIESPYGRSDAAFHYQLARMVSENIGMDNCDSCLYYSIFNGNYFYPPFTHYVTGLTSRFTGIQLQYIVFPVSAFLSVFLLFTTFILIKKAVGSFPAFGALIFLVFSHRGVYSLFWGQWPSIYSISFMPLAFFFIYDLREKPYNLKFFTATLGLMAITYPQTAIFTLITSIFYLLLTGLPSINKKQITISIIIFTILILPMLPRLSGIIQQVESEKSQVKFSLEKLNWYTAYRGGYPNTWFDFIHVYHIWAIPLLLLGVLSVAQQIKTPFVKLILTLLVMQYLITHIFLLGIGSQERASRAVNQEPFIFSLIIAAGFQIPRNNDGKIIVVLLGLMLAYTSLTDVRYAIITMNPSRINHDELKAFQWIRENTTSNDDIILFGGDLAITTPWGTALTQRRFITMTDGKYYFQDYHITKEEVKNPVFLFDLYLPNVENSKEYANYLIQVNNNLAKTTHIAFLGENNGEKIVIRKPKT